MSSFNIEWIDAQREPAMPPNPSYPNGVDIDGSGGAAVTCEVSLPYPAARCGAFIIECRTCGLKVAVTTAGRADDPKTIKLACKGPRWAGG
ncbi:MAG: hypothetical protein IT537_08655 [Hyphomicrobiales bacterium]|nr:hypothetical protein [Hyphomicrobiales bacterium]